MDYTIHCLVLISMAIWIFRVTRGKQRHEIGCVPRFIRQRPWEFGALRFFTDRESFIRNGRKKSPSGHFSFHIGRKTVIVVSGEEGRNFILRTKGLDLAQGYAELLNTVPAITAESNEDQLPTFWFWCSRKIVSLVQTSSLERYLPVILQDTDAWIAKLATPTGADAAEFDPFDGPYRLVYQFTMRIMGVQDMAESPNLLMQSLDLYETIAQSTSPLRIVFPYLPTPAYLRRLWAGIRLYRMMSKIVAKRAAASEYKDDALQQVMDEGRSPEEIVAFMSAAVFAGNLTNAYIVAWTLLYLASNQEWQNRVREEVQQVLDTQRTMSHQSDRDIFSTLTLEQWLNCFPLVELCQRETIRLQHVGCFYRRNISGKSLAIGSCGEVVPPEAFVVYPLDEVHLDSKFYKETMTWEPQRFLEPTRVEDRVGALTYIGWGAGRHPCPGMRAAKLQATIIAAKLVANHNLSLVDLEGNICTEVPLPDRTQAVAQKALKPVRIKFILAVTLQASLISQNSMNGFYKWSMETFDARHLTGLAIFFVAVFLLYEFSTYTHGIPRAAPPQAGGWRPIVGMLQFFSDRQRFILDNIKLSKSGNFRFNIGKHNVICLSGVQGRKAFFDQKDLNLPAAYAVLFNNTPPQPKDYIPSRTGAKYEFTGWFLQKLTRFMQKDYIREVLPRLLEDTQRQIKLRMCSPEGVASGTIDPFDVVFKIVYQLTIRTLGPTEIAESQTLADETLDLFEMIVASASPWKVIFPWLPTPGHFKRAYAGAKLYGIVRKLVQDRKASDQKLPDAVQHLIDDGAGELNTLKASSFVLGVLYAGQLNTGVSAAWILTYLAVVPEWYNKIREEVDSVLCSARSNADQSSVDILSTLSVEQWEGLFPQVELCLKETIRFQVTATAMRQNLGHSDLPIGSTGKIIPKDWFAVYLVDEAHFNPEIYEEPQKWDPSRYLPGREEHLKEPHCFSAWGSGRHPCLGMKFAKLEVNIITAYFVALFDFHAVDVNGVQIHDQPRAARAGTLAAKPEEGVRLQYQSRAAAVA